MRTTFTYMFIFLKEVCFVYTAIIISKDVYNNKNQGSIIFRSKLLCVTFSHTCYGLTYQKEDIKLSKGLNIFLNGWYNFFTNMSLQKKSDKNVHKSCWRKKQDLNLNVRTSILKTACFIALKLFSHHLKLFCMKTKHIF